MRCYRIKKREMAFSSVNLAVDLMMYGAGKGFRSTYGLMSEKVPPSAVLQHPRHACWVKKKS